MCNNDSFQFSDITNPYTPVRDHSIYGKGTAINQNGWCIAGKLDG